LPRLPALLSRQVRPLVLVEDCTPTGLQLQRWLLRLRLRYAGIHGG